MPKAELSPDLTPSPHVAFVDALLSTLSSSYLLLLSTAESMAPLWPVLGVDLHNWLVLLVLLEVIALPAAIVSQAYHGTERKKIHRRLTQSLP